MVIMNRQTNMIEFLDRQIKKQGAAKIIAAPVTVLAAIGGAVALFGNNWVIFGAVVGGGIALLAFVLLTVELSAERARTSALDQELANLKEKFSDSTARLDARILKNETAIDVYSMEVEKLR